MRRYWIPKESVQGHDVRLTGDTLHHIRDVCRMHLGSKFEVITDGGHAHLIELTHESKKESIGQIIETRQIPPLPEPHVILVMSIPRFPVFEAVVEKAVEMGVTAVQPFFSEFSFIRARSDVWDKKLPRFEKIVQSATQQSGRGERMEIRKPLSVEDLMGSFNRTEGSAGLFAYEGEAVLTARQGLTEIRSSQPRQVWLFVGSEGGFSEKEVEYFQSVGLKSVTLGPQVLRVETACVALVSIIKYDLDLMR